MRKIFIIASIFLLASACSKPPVKVVNPPPQPVFDGHLQIDSPKEGDVIDSTFTITGKAQGWFEGTVPVSVHDLSGNQLYSSSFTLDKENYEQAASFTQTITLTRQATRPTGWIEFDDYSEKDGSIVYRRVINIKFKNFVSVKPLDLPITYGNQMYGFNFSLPADWKGYSIVKDSWTGNYLDGSSKTITGPVIKIRNPLWTKAKPYEDIPVMVFTIDEWSAITQEKLSVSAAPIAPSELGRNQTFVFALPARYNYDFNIGFEEVEQIIQNDPLQAW